ncbi:hypothetical protein HRbin06_00683 [archaeon HR06]|nr:hypothetical protein HRbin06_00683 [archaeon HR06]
MFIKGLYMESFGLRLNINKAIKPKGSRNMVPFIPNI